MKWLTLIFCTLLTSQLLAQGTIKGKIVDSSGKKPLGLATITVFKAADTALVTYRLSTPEGDFKVPGLPLNIPCRIVVSFSGYDAYRKEFTLTNDTPVEMGTIELYPSSKSLEEVLVIAERPPVMVRKDTVEFNVSSFKTLPTALVEDLLKKLPGVEVDRDGNILANGKKVNRIMVDGKSFFGDDPKMATRNLPSNVIDKIQVTDDKEEAARNIDGDLSQVGKVINLTLKKGVKKGWFGKVYGGVGTNDRYEAGGIANIYRDTLQLSVLGFSNNINRSGFSFKEIQDLGGFNRSGFNSLMVSSRGGQTGFAINGISFGGIDGGLSRTTGGGFNLNHAPDKRKSFFLQYFIGKTNSLVDNLTNAQQFLQDTILNTLTHTINNREAASHNFSAGANLKPDTLTDINFRSSYSYTANGDNIDAAINAQSNKVGTVSQAAGTQTNSFYNNDYNHNLFLTRRFAAKKGRTLNIFHTFSYRSNLQKYITESDNDYYYPFVYSQDFDQLRRQVTPTISGMLSANWAEPLSKKWTLRFNNRYEYLRDQQDINIYDKNPLTAKYEVINPKSTGFVRTQNRVSSNLTLAYKIGQVTLSGGIGGLWQGINNDFKNIAQPIKMNLFNVLPNFSLNWKQLTVQYNPTVVAPSATYLNPVPDSTNPFSIRLGNPYLRPAYRHSFYVSNFQFLQGSNTSLNIYMNGSFVNDDVIMARTVAANGVQTSYPVNANGSVQFYANAGIGKEFKNNQKFIFSFRVSPNFNFDKRKLIVNSKESYATNIQWGPSVNIGLNWNDVVEFRPMYSPSFSSTSYTDNAFANIKTVTQYSEGELIIRWPKRLVWETTVAYRYTDNVAPGLPKENILWNAAVTLLMFKGDVGMLKLGVFDLLDRNNGLFRYTTQNQIIDQQTNVLKRYASLSFTYNIRNMGATGKKVGGKDRFFMF